MLQVAIDVAMFIALMSAAVLCVYLIITLKDVRNVLHNATNTLAVVLDQIKELKYRLNPLLQSLEDTSKEGTKVLTHVDGQLQKADKAINEVVEFTHYLSTLTTYVNRHVVEPLSHLVAVIAGAKKAMDIFSEKMHTNGRRESSTKKEPDDVRPGEIDT